MLTSHNDINFYWVIDAYAQILKEEDNDAKDPKHANLTNTANWEYADWRTRTSLESKVYC